MNARTVDDAISRAWLEAAEDLEIRVTAPFALLDPENELITYEAHILDFGGQKGTVLGVLDDEMGDIRAMQGYYYSNLAPSYRKYSRQRFVDTLNDWGWFGPAERQPAWYTGKSWS